GNRVEAAMLTIGKPATPADTALIASRLVTLLIGEASLAVVHRAQKHTARRSQRSTQIGSASSQHALYRQQRTRINRHPEYPSSLIDVCRDAGVAPPHTVAPFRADTAHRRARGRDHDVRSPRKRPEHTSISRLSWLL